ncbi:MAG TPA: hypothetical protein PLJ12_08685, partial [Planctomycetota bacterium]|nr:hypothetical protein [Planctomycetota bacterium]
MPFVRVRHRASLLLLPLLFACATGGTEVRAPQPTVLEVQPGDPVWPTPQPWSPKAMEFDVEHYALDLNLLVPTHEIQGRLSIDFLSVDSATLKTIQLDCAELQVQRVLGERGGALRFEQAGDRLVVELAQPLAFQDPASITIEYRGKPRKGLYFVPTDPVHQVFTQGECEGARYWFPCQDRPDDRATSELTVHMPAAWVSLAAG